MRAGRSRATAGSGGSRARRTLALTPTIRVVRAWSYNLRMLEVITLVWLAVAVACIFICDRLAASSGRDPDKWALLGSAFGPVAIAVLILLSLEDTRTGGSRAKKRAAPKSSTRSGPRPSR